MGVALLNGQSDASAQGGDLEHTGHTFFFHSQRQPAHRTRASAQAWGTSSVFLSEDAAPVPLDKGLHAETNLWPCSGLAWWATGELSADQHSGWQNLANGRQ